MENLKPLILLGGLNAAELWQTTNLAIPGWLLLVVAPRWKYTKSLSLVGPILCSIIYALTLISLMLTDDDSVDISNFTSLEGVATMFQDPTAVFGGWMHYSAYDALIGRWIVMDSIKRGSSLTVHYILIVPCLFFALMLGPTGFILYLLVRTFILKGGDCEQTSTASSTHQGGKKGN